MTLGIGLITYQRKEKLIRTVEHIKQFTTVPYYLIVADDGSTDGTVEWCHQNRITVITGANRGVCWNKNRALFALISYAPADPIILLEDDCFPNAADWAPNWIKAAQLAHHVNYAHTGWPAGWCRGGHGTAGEPWYSWEITGQATITTREALQHVGYLNPNFQGYGFGHIEWTERFCKAGYINREFVPCIRCGLIMEDEATFRNMNDVNRNRTLIDELRHKPFAYCHATRSHEEASLFRTVEVASAIHKQYPLVRGPHMSDMTEITKGVWQGAYPNGNLPEEIDVVVNLSGDHPPEKYHGKLNGLLWMPTADPVFPGIWWLDTIVDYIIAARRMGRQVLIHCACGISRSTLVTAAYLMKSCSMSAQDALELVKSQRPAADPSPKYIVALARYQQTLEERKDVLDKAILATVWPHVG